jgi:predicted RNase H-like HicB family nuclease
MATIAQVMVRIDANLTWRFTIGEGGHYVAICDPLKLTLQARTWADLMEDTADVLNAVFQDLLSSNELDKFLGAHGWSLMGQVPTQHQENVRFDVPFFFVPEMAHDDGSTKHLHQ